MSNGREFQDVYDIQLHLWHWGYPATLSLASQVKSGEAVKIGEAHWNIELM